MYHCVYVLIRWSYSQYCVETKVKHMLIADQLLALEEIDPSVMASAEFYRALSLRQTGKEDEAVEKFKKLTRTLRKLTIDNPESTDIFIYRLLTHSALKEYDVAFELADYLGKVSPDEASVHAFRSLIYKDMGEQEKADGSLLYYRTWQYDENGDKLSYYSYLGTGELDHYCIFLYDESGRFFGQNFYDKNGSLFDIYRP